MRNALDRKRDKISNIWNNYIWEYKFCSSKIKFTPDVQSNYFGDILKYFSDTHDLIYNNEKVETFSDNFKTTVSFLQAIYIQQDFIEELLHIFKCHHVKGDLKKDLNYSINRELRNELVGHPIRKSEIQGTRQLLSSTIFSNKTNSNQISYIRYHVDNNYRFEKVTHKKEDVLKRHSSFLEFYFDIIIKKLKSILSLFEKKIVEIENVIAHAEFENIVQIVSCSFEYILKYKWIYNPDILRQVYTMKNSNQRYSNVIEMFQKDLNDFLIDTKEDIISIINDTDRHTLKLAESEHQSCTTILIGSNDEIPECEIPVSYHYVLEKLADRHYISDFDFFSSLLKSKCKNKKLVLAELKNMKINLNNPLEYYCSFYLIKKELNG